jgi:hypothetical protein
MSKLQWACDIAEVIIADDNAVCSAAYTWYGMLGEGAGILRMEIAGTMLRIRGHSGGANQTHSSVRQVSRGFEKEMTARW